MGIENRELNIDHFSEPHGRNDLAGARSRAGTVDVIHPTVTAG
jgi:hypothetical protein